MSESQPKEKSSSAPPASGDAGDAMNQDAEDRHGLQHDNRDSASYDDRTLQAARLYAQARIRSGTAQGTSDAWGIFKQMTSLERVIAAQSEGIHKIQRIDEEGGQHCSCGLIIPSSYDDPFNAPGHLAVPGTDTTTLFVGVSPSTGSSEAAQSEYVAICQRCQCTGSPMSLEQARRHLRDHQHEESDPAAR